MITTEERKKLQEAGLGGGVSKPKSSLAARLQQKVEAKQQQVVSDRQSDARGGDDTSFKDIFGNILPSAGTAIKDIGTAILNPIDTTKAVGKAGIGAVQKLIPGEQEYEENANAVGQFFKDRYGSLDAAKQTFINDPVGFMLDASVVIGGAGTAAKTAGTLSKSSRLAKAGDVAVKASKAVDPLSHAGKVVNKVTKGGLAAAGELIGVTTGVGSDVLKEAFRNPSEEFTKALRGQTNKLDLVESSKSALNSLKDKRSQEYRSRLEKISNIKDDIDISSLKSKLDENLEKFNIKVADDGSLDFSRSTISKAEGIADVEGVYRTLKDWGTQAGDMTPLGLDLLKRRLGDLYSESGQARAFVNSLETNVRDLIVKKVPEYADMTSGYERASSFIKDVEKSLSLGNKAGTETAIKKLVDGLKTDKEFRNALIRELDELTPVDLTGRIAGTALQDLLPKGLTGKLFAGGAVGTGLVGGVINMLAFLPAFSPRLMGEFIRGMGIASEKIQPIIKAVEIVRDSVPVGQSAFQSGRVEEVVNE